jgi:hypothetical protein
MIGFALIDVLLLAVPFWQLYEPGRERSVADKDRKPRE